MSQADIERFTRDLQSNEQLRNEVKSGASGLASIVDIAKRHGYDVTIDEVRAHMRGQVPQNLTDEQLEALAGGAGDPTSAIAQSVTQAVTNITAIIAVNTSASTSTSGPAIVATGPTVVTYMA
jgi:predicted ribosomally synthesized peptide with nif11-like leader